MNARGALLLMLGGSSKRAGRSGGRERHLLRSVALAKARKFVEVIKKAPMALFYTQSQVPAK